VAEALWKGTPVIGEGAGGTKLQIKDGLTGFLISTVEEAAERVVSLCESPERRPPGSRGPTGRKTTLFHQPSPGGLAPPPRAGFGNESRAGAMMWDTTRTDLREEKDVKLC
jgi:hypothetical protein